MQLNCYYALCHTWHWKLFSDWCGDVLAATVMAVITIKTPEDILSPRGVNLILTRQPESFGTQCSSIKTQGNTSMLSNSNKCYYYYLSSTLTHAVSSAVIKWSEAFVVNSWNNTRGEGQSRPAALLQFWQHTPPPVSLMNLPHINPYH